MRSTRYRDAGACAVRICSSFAMMLNGAGIDDVVFALFCCQVHAVRTAMELIADC